jgi:tetratricopeptide (TPR) repeat protein
MGWIILIAMALILFAILWRVARLDTGPLQFLLSALLLALAGYAWQGRPTVEGAPRSAVAEKRVAPNPFAEVRRDVFGGFDAADRWLTISESYQRRGDTRAAAAVLRSGIKAHPRNAALWTGYGNALLLHGNGTISPSADLAFRRAVGLAPRHPGPRLFYGIALMTGGRVADAEQVWRQALALVPPKAPYRSGLEQQLAMIAQARSAGQIP